MATPTDHARSATQRSSVRELRDDERARVAEALARAFHDDPVFRWFLPDDSRRIHQLERIFAFLGGRVWFPHGLTFTTEDVVGAAIWVPPERWRVGILDQLRLTPGLVSSVGLRDLPRMLRGFNRIESKHPHDRHYYLPIVGVEPSSQGRGIGTALLRPMLESCDRERLPAYLQATTPRNLACYERAGFEVVEELRLPGGPPIWPMRREPRTADAI